MNIQFPSGDGIEGFVYWLLSQIMGWGWVSYGFAIVFFTLFIKLILAPLDFLNRFLSRRTQIKQQALAAEVADLNKTYANDPLMFTRARSELYRKNGVGGLGSSLVTLTSLIVTMVIFFQVFGALNNIARLNLKNECNELQAVYAKYAVNDEIVDTENFQKELNATYHDCQSAFGWIKSIWQPDTFWDKPVPGYSSFNDKLPDDKQLSEKAYDTIVDNLDDSRSNNGFLLLAVLAAVTSFLSSKITSVMAKRNAPKTVEEKKAEPIITYSLRDAKLQANGAEKPMVDAAQMGKIMQFVMPAIFMLFAIMQTSAFAIYMIASSVVSTGLTLLFSWLIDMILKRMPVKTKDQDFDATVINPHAKYFKGGRK